MKLYFWESFFSKKLEKITPTVLMVITTLARLNFRVFPDTIKLIIGLKLIAEML